MENYVKLIPLEVIRNRVKNLIKYSTPILGNDKIELIDALITLDYINGSVEYYNALWHKLRVWLSTSHPTLFPIHRYPLNRVQPNQSYRKYPRFDISSYGTYGFQNSSYSVEPYSISTIANFHSDENRWIDNGTACQTTFANFNTY